ncbi:MAG: glycosyltransferase [Candidatus Omnitrophica bacterium]|nr:glycosyltransferase [Candidatus Omnitrophota bacterium]
MEKSKLFNRISIVTPSLDQEGFLERTIKSVVRQTRPPYEYFVIDGGSSDESVEIIKKHHHSISYWVSEPDKGQSEAINKGFRRASGEWLCWLNGDDVLFPNALEKVQKVINSTQGIDIITGNIVCIDKNDVIIKCIKTPGMNWYLYGRGVGSFTAPAVFFRKKLYEEARGLDDNLHISMDVDLWHKFREKNARIYHINEYLGAFRIHSSSKTVSFRGEGKDIFEHPETVSLREKYLPSVSEDTVKFFRVLFKLHRMVRLHYIKGWIDHTRWKNKRWWEVFT